MILSKKYKEEINKIVMNNDMKKRILQNVLAAKENSEEKKITSQTIVPKVKKYNKFKRNMQIVAAGFTIVLCLSIAKSYPMLLKNAPNHLKQSETADSQNDENNDLKSNDDNELVNNNDSKEVSNNDHKEDQTLNQNNNINKKSSNGSKEESNASSEIGTEEKNNYNSKSNSEPAVVKNQTSQTNDSKTTGNSNVSSKTNPEEAVNNKENKNVISSGSQTPPVDTKKNKIQGNNTDNNVLDRSVMSEEAVNYNQEYKTLDEAEKALNLKVNSLKTMPKGFKMESITVISNKIIQEEYNDGNSNITFRAGEGIDNISGDYNVYQVKNTVKANGISVNLEGNKSEEYNLAVWEKDGISYSISSENGIDEKTILDMIL
jgi:hypothetical protein